jgi:hypothetical protein
LRGEPVGEWVRADVRRGVAAELGHDPAEDPAVGAAGAGVLGAAQGYPIDPADVARLTPLGHPAINLDGRYRITSRPPATGLRPLRTN